MTAKAADRAHTHQVELAMETRAQLLDARDVDGREDATRTRVGLFLDAAMTALRAESALDALGDAKRERAIVLVTELAGLLDHRQPLPSHNPAAAADAVGPSTVSPAAGAVTA